MQEEIKKLKLEVATLQRQRDSLEKETEKLQDDILFLQDKLKEAKVLTARQKKQCDEMLPYREIIGKEIEIKKNELEEYKKQALQEKTKIEELTKASRKNDIDFKALNQQRTDAIAKKEQELDIRQAEIEDNLFAIDKERQKTEIGRATLASDMVKVNEKLKEATKILNQLAKDKDKSDQKKAELNQREAKISLNEKQTSDRMAETDAIFVLIAKDKALILEENKAILIQRRLLREKELSIEDDRLHLFSQQEAFKLAITEAKKKWQMPK